MPKVLDKIDGVAVFACECNGCRQRDKVERYRSAFRVSQIVDELNGYYFSEGARRFFSVRLTGWELIRAVSGDVVGVVIHSTKSANPSGSERVADRALFCRFGWLVEAYSVSEWRAVDPLAVLAGCVCHGCAISRGRAVS